MSSIKFRFEASVNRRFSTVTAWRAHPSYAPCSEVVWSAYTKSRDDTRRTCTGTTAKRNPGKRIKWYLRVTNRFFRILLLRRCRPITIALYQWRRVVRKNVHSHLNPNILLVKLNSKMMHFGINVKRKCWVICSVLFFYQTHEIGLFTIAYTYSERLWRMQNSRRGKIIKYVRMHMYY